MVNGTHSKILGNVIARTDEHVKLKFARSDKSKVFAIMKSISTGRPINVGAMVLEKSENHEDRIWLR